MTTKQHQSNIIEARRMQVNPLIRQNVDLSFQIVDRIHEILVAKGLKQKDLAIEKALGAPILQVVHQGDSSPTYEFESMMASEPLSPPEP